ERAVDPVGDIDILPPLFCVEPEILRVRFHDSSCLSGNLSGAQSRSTKDENATSVTTNVQGNSQ
ncbi:MAG: hypothetical protein KAT85_09285, partial [candidate division Zixibacteria bacterium]|nr:hypothetical protein [candidate division Zixibacteria bacterium]